MGRWLFLPDSVEKDLEILSRSTVERINRVRALLDSDKGLREFAVYIRVAEILQISDEEAARLYAFWEYIQNERTENEKTGDDAVDEFASFLRGRIATGKKSVGSVGEEDSLKEILRQIEEKKVALSRLFQDCPNRDLAKKTSRLEAGPLPHLAGINSYCDIRPVYNKDGTEIVEHLVMITLRLATHDRRLDENKDVLINLNERDLDRIETELLRIRNKLEVLKKSLPSRSMNRTKKTRR
jgi:hypothetical protein